MRQARRTVIALLLMVCTSLIAQQTRTTSTGVYSAAQAAAGEKIYFDKCASCHGDDLAGREQAPALSGARFVDAWAGRDLRQLLDRIDTMPPTAPKSLSPADSVALLALLLRDSGMPAGAALPTDRGELARITFQRA